VATRIVLAFLRGGANADQFDLTWSVDEPQLALFDATPSGTADSMRTMHASLAIAETRATAPRCASRLRVAGLFAGIGGIELGFRRAGHESVLLCEIDLHAKAVLEERFPDVPLVADVRDIPSLPAADVVAAGFPCQDLSQAGRTAGIAGRQSGLISEVFRLVADPDRAPKWPVLENVPFMLQLDRGEAMRFLTRSLVELGYSWAYRVVDARSFGLPQRRKRVILVASRSEDPRGVLFADDASPSIEEAAQATAFGFYWTEGIGPLGVFYGELGKGACDSCQVSWRTSSATSDSWRRPAANRHCSQPRSTFSLGHR
jgi:site-specific DNA-cytosine methylase